MYIWGPSLSSQVTASMTIYERRAPLTDEQQAFNQSMSQVRVSVEWIFGDIVDYFKFIDYKKNLKIGLSSVGNFILSVLF